MISKSKNQLLGALYGGAFALARLKMDHRVIVIPGIRNSILNTNSTQGNIIVYTDNANL